MQVATPSRERVDQYRILRDDIDRLVGRINGDLGRIGRPAISYLHSSFPREEMAALYRAADIMVVTPFRDGMNLVAKEYVACRFDDDGALVLSEFAGAADELRQAYLVNPYDINGMKATMLEAYRAQPKERTRRMRAMRKTVSENDVAHWASTFLDELSAPSPPTPSRPAPPAVVGGAVSRGGAALRRVRAQPAGWSASAAGRAVALALARLDGARLGAHAAGLHQVGDLLGELGAELAPAVLVAVDLAQRRRRVVAAQDVDVLGGDQAGVGDADGLGDLDQLLAEGAEVLRAALALA